MKKIKCLIIFAIAMITIILFVPPNFAATTENAALVGEEEYASFEEAIEVAKNGEEKTIKLLSDLNYDSFTVLDVDGLTIDLNSHTIYAKNFTLIFQGENFVIKNGTLCCTNSGSYALFIGDEGTTNNVLIENVNTIGGINVYNARNVQLKDVDVQGTNYYAVWCDENAEVIIKNGSYQAGDVALFGVTTDANSSLTIYDGNFTANDKPMLCPGSEYPTIYGGSFDINVSEEYIAENRQVKQINGKYVVCEYEKNTEIEGIDVNAEVSDVTIGVTDATKVEEFLLEELVNNKELEDKIKNRNIEVAMNINEIEASSELKDKIKQEVSIEGIKLASCFDITINVMDMNTTEILGTLSELSEKISMSVLLPEELLNLEDGIQRKFYVIMEHNGKLGIIEPTLNANYLTFETDRFSTYTIAYADSEINPEEKESEGISNNETKGDELEQKADTTNNMDNPKTGDNTIITFTAFVLALIVTSGTVIINKKRIKYNK